MHILFCYEGLITTSQFVPNHFVPLIFSNMKHRTSGSGNLKRKSVVLDGNMCAGNKLQTKLAFPNINSKDFNAGCASNNTSVSTFFSEYKKSIPTPISKVKTPVEETSVFHTVYDIGSYRKKVVKLNDTEIYKLITNVFIPDQSYKFPVRYKRHFKFQWLSDFPWLGYSPAYDGAFCLPCVLFGDSFLQNVTKYPCFFSIPQSHWPDAVPSFKRHNSTKSGLHQETSIIFSSFVNRMSGVTQSVDVLLDSHLEKQVSEN